MAVIDLDNLITFITWLIVVLLKSSAILSGEKSSSSLWQDSLLLTSGLILQEGNHIDRLVANRVLLINHILEILVVDQPYLEISTISVDRFQALDLTDKAHQKPDTAQQDQSC